MSMDLKTIKKPKNQKIISGKPDIKFRLQPIPVSAEEKEKFFSKMEESGINTQTSFLRWILKQHGYI